MTSLAYDSIRAAILTQALTPGLRVSEAVGKALQVSETPVHEALLSKAGLIVPEGRRGWWLPEPLEDAFGRPRVSCRPGGADRQPGRPQRHRLRPGARRNSLNGATECELIAEMRRRQRSIGTVAAVLAEVIRGRPTDAAVFAGLRRERIEVRSVDTRVGIRAGQLLGAIRSGSELAVDAFVVAVGDWGAVVATVDLTDLRRLAEHATAVLIVPL